MQHPHMNHPDLAVVHSTTNQSATQLWIVLIAALLSAYVIQRVVSFFDVPVSALFELLWNCFVYLMPSRLVLGLNHNSSISSPLSNDTPGVHAAKSEVLRRVFGLAKTARILQQSALSGVPPGLGNWDNSCYQNSVLQSFASLPALPTFFDKVNSQASAVPPIDSTFCALQSLVFDLNNLSKGAQFLWTPPKLKSMSSWQQQDAQEYFSKIMEQLDKDIAAASKEEISARPITDMLNKTTLSIRPEDVSVQSQDPVKEDTAGPRRLETYASSAYEESRSLMLNNPLEGLLAQRVGCTRCGFSEGLSLIPFNCITLPLGREYQYSIRDCLNAYTDLEHIEGVECTKCTLVQSQQQLRNLLQSFAISQTEESCNSYSTPEEVSLRLSIETRLQAVTGALDEEDFADATLSEKCKIPSRMRASTTKTRQAIIARAPQCLVLHVNRSLFDETTGNQLKNYADVQFPRDLDISRWSVGSGKARDGRQDPVIEEWDMDPSRSMIRNDKSSRLPRCSYQLRAVITHYGRHENGHYICYRKVPTLSSDITVDVRSDDQPGEADDSLGIETAEQWWRLSDEDVSKVTEEEVLSQGGVFMLFYERIEEIRSLSDCQANINAAEVEVVERISPEVLQNDDVQLPAILNCEPSVASLVEQSEEIVQRITVPSPRLDPIVGKSHAEPATSASEDARLHSNSPISAKSPEDMRKKPRSPTAMRTAGLLPRGSDEHLPQLMSPRMVATL